MREIKFRAWEESANRMHPRVESGVYEDPDEIIDFDRVLGLARFEVMQYTGLKDKNGQEIYEGDLIPSNSIKNHNIFEVVYGRCSFLFIRETGSIYRADQLLWSDIEIIGHIHQTGNSRKLDILYDDHPNSGPKFPF